MKSLLVLTSTLPRFAGDPEPRFVLDLSKELARYYRVTVLAPADTEAASEETLEGVRVIRYRYAPMRSMQILAYPGAILPRLRRNPLLWALVPLLLLGLGRAASRLLSRESFDCIHCHWLLPQGLIGYYLQWRFGAPYVVTSHGADVFALSGAFVRWLKFKILSRAAAVTVVSNALRDEVLSTVTQLSAMGPVSVIPMGVDTHAFNPSKRDEYWAHAHGLNRPVIAFVGRLSEKKGVRFLIEAMALLELRTGATLAIVGNGELRAELEEQVRNRKLGDRVIFCGGADHRRLPVILASADIFCLPSIVAKGGDREGMPTVLCEAAASGVAIVASNLSGITDFVVHERTGILVPPEDPQELAAALARLLTDPALKTSLAMNARARAAEFDWCALAQRFNRVIDAAIQGARDDDQ